MPRAPPACRDLPIIVLVSDSRLLARLVRDVPCWHPAYGQPVACCIDDRFDLARDRIDHEQFLADVADDVRLPLASITNAVRRLMRCDVNRAGNLQEPRSTVRIKPGFRFLLYT